MARMGFLFGFSWQQDGWCQIHGQKNGQLGNVVCVRSAKKEVDIILISSAKWMDKTRMLFTSSNCGGENQLFVVEGAVLGS
ncbi:MAG: hypothetical protein LKF47_02595 [Megasphaera sp.]|jgi:hypothetical protein|nr:hypothetical protein [Megasphaera sp.]MCI1247488.1 hypothetical protein [Megasphaera sp.]